jgi:hypothetical protein
MMTNCIGLPAERSLEQYLQGTLPELEARAFEDHYFDCPVCLAQVEALQAVAAQFALPSAAAPVLIFPRRRTTWLALSAVGAVAALLLIGFFTVRSNRANSLAATVHTPSASPSITLTPVPSSSTPATSVAALADLSLPPYVVPHLRGGGDDTHFAAGMVAYSAQDCPAAIRSLSAVPPHGDYTLAALFYSGVCQMHERDLSAASATLHRVESAGDSPQQEAALYYLAQLALVRDDPGTARHYLARTISLRGEFEKRAHAELENLK